MASNFAVVFATTVVRRLAPAFFSVNMAGEIEVAAGAVLPAAHAASHAAAGSDPILGPLSLQAGSATAGTAPLKLASGPLMLTPEAGAIERLVDKLYLTISAGVRKMFVLADSSLTSGRIPYTTTDGRLLDTANFTRDPVTGDITLGAGANLVLTGAAALGTGNIVMKAAASAAFDTNLIISDSTARTMGFICGVTPGFAGAYGPFFGLRGNTYAAYVNQRGNMFFYGGKPSAPSVLEGRLVFGTNDIERLTISYAGLVSASNMAVVDLTSGQPVYATTSGRLTSSAPYAAKTANYTLAATDRTIRADATGGSFTLTLPTAVGHNREYYIKCISAVNVVTVATTSSQTIDDVTSLALAQWDCLHVQSDGANWMVL